MTTTRSASRKPSAMDQTPATDISDGTNDGHPDAVSEATQSATQAVSRVADTARTTLTDQANTQRLQAAETATRVAGAMHRVSGELQAEQPTVANIADSAASQAERLGQFLRQTDASEILTTTQDFARRQPLAFYGAAFALGLAAARMLKAASASERPRTNGPANNNGSYSMPMEATGPGRASTRSAGI